MTTIVGKVNNFQLDNEINLIVYISIFHIVGYNLLEGCEFNLVGVNQFVRESQINKVEYKVKIMDISECLAHEGYFLKRF